MGLYQSPCKVNLILNILGRRPDGFHDLETLFQRVPVCDQLEVENCSGEFRFTCSTDRVPAGSGNLVYRAAMAFFEAAGIPPVGRIHLQKNLPSEAGLGGGSADAATALRGLNREFGGLLTSEQLHKAATALGSDVPFFLQDYPALGTGRGENLQILEPFAALSGVWIVLVKPSFGVATGWAYKTLAQYPKDLNGHPGRAKELAEVLRTGTLAAAAPLFYNSLEAPVLAEYPVLSEYQKFLRCNGADVTLMSGSGSTTFALVQDKAVAQTLPGRVKAQFGDDVWVAVAAL